MWKRFRKGWVRLHAGEILQGNITQIFRRTETAGATNASIFVFLSHHKCRPLASLVWVYFSYIPMGIVGFPDQNSIALVVLEEKFIS
jgi:hypothetical protein